MYEIRLDYFKNRLYVTLNGVFHYEEMKTCTDKTIAEASKLQRGYDVISDISQFKVINAKTLAEFQRGQVFFRQTGVRHTIRVKANISLVSSQASLAGRLGGHAAMVASTVAEAEQYLDYLN
jgi:hypothetical protein